MIIMGRSVANGSAPRAFAKAGFRRLRQYDDPEYGRFWVMLHSASSAGGFE